MTSATEDRESTDAPSEDAATPGTSTSAATDPDARHAPDAPDAPVEDPSEEQGTDDAPATSSGRSTAWIAWTVAAALAVVAAVAVLQWQAVQGPVATQQAARDAAVAYTEVLTEWDAGNGLEETYAGLVAGATESFVPEIDEVFSADAREELVAADAVSDGTITDTLTGEPEEDGVDVVVIVEQFVVTGPTADPAARTERVAQFRMVQRDGRWLVDDLTMLSELQIAEEAQ